MSSIVNSFITRNGNPQLGLNPTIRIWEVTGTPVQVVTDEQCVEVGDGFYTYNYAGYDADLLYVARVAAPTLPLNSRYYTTEMDNAVDVSQGVIADIVNGVWDEPTSSHTVTGSTGALITETNNNIIAAVSILHILLKYEANRTRIDKSAMTLTVYDDDGVTPLRVFDLKDSSGAGSITEVFERRPR